LFFLFKQKTAYEVRISDWSSDVCSSDRFAMPLLLAAALFYVSPATHRDFTASDHLLAAIIVTMGAAAYLNGFLIGQHTLRFAAALYNLSIWVCGLIVLQQARKIGRAHV